MKQRKTTTKGRAVACALCIGAMLSPLAAGAQEANAPITRATPNSEPKTQHQPAPKAQPHEGKVLGSIARGTDAAGRGIERAGEATRRGVDHTAERAGAPMRRWGEALGRKLGIGPAKSVAAVGVGPQGNAP